MLERLGPCTLGPCHHGMARPQVADRGTASNMDSRQDGIYNLGVGQGTDNTPP